MSRLRRRNPRQSPLCVEALEARRLLTTWYVSDSSLYSGSGYSTPMPGDATDDYAAINWLLHTRSPRPQAGDTVQFSEPDGDTGEYIFAYTNSRMVLPAGITYTGANTVDWTNDTIINQPIPGTPSNGHAVWQLDNNDPNDVTIRNFVFEHEGIWLVSDHVQNVTADNDLIVKNGDLEDITGWLKTGFENSGGDEWLGSGIGSTEAEADNDTAQSILYGLGVILNDLSQVGGSGPVYSTFAGQSVGVTDILVKFTYMGDADLNGVVDATDYSQIDNGYVNGLGDWINGDFDYAAPINATDYALIDNAFVNQGDPLRAGSGSQDVLSSVAAELFGKMADEYDLLSPEQMIARHSKLFGQAYDDALAKVQGGNRP